MTKIFGCEIELYPEWDNNPTTKIEIDHYPNPKEFVFDQAGNSYRAETDDGIVQFFYWGGKQDSGFGGQHFPIRMRGGSEVVLKGPWSSNAESINKEFPNLPPVAECTIVERDYGGSRVAGAARSDLIARLMDWKIGLTYTEYLTILYTLKYQYCNAREELKFRAERCEKTIKNLVTFGNQWGWNGDVIR